MGYSISEESKRLIKSLDRNVDISKNESKDYKALLAEKDRRIAELEEQVDRLTVRTAMRYEDDGLPDENLYETEG